MLLCKTRSVGFKGGLGVTNQVSMVRRCHETETRPISFDEIWETTRSGNHGLKEKITHIRNCYVFEKDSSGDSEKAKKAIADLKMQLPGFLPSGNFKERNNAALIEHSGILCADLDSLGERLPMVKAMLSTLPFVRAIALSPSGDGLKVFFNVINDPARHEDSFRAIKENMRDLELEVDEKCKDPARICFFTYDPELWVRTEGNEILPPADPLPRARTRTTNVPPASLTSREQIAFRLVGELRHDPDKGGYFVRCPGESFHSAKTADKHTILYLESVPTLSCQHESCKHVVESFNHVLRSEIGKAEFVPQSRNGDTEIKIEVEKPVIRFFTIGELQAYEPPPGMVLVGDRHLVKGTTVVLGGPPGVGKSRAIMFLGYCAATGNDWFGMPVHRTFKMMVIQNENGMYRLHEEAMLFDKEIVKDNLLVCDPPECGLCFRRGDFREVVKNAIATVMPDVVALDPFNAVAQDQDSREYLQSIDLLRSVLPTGDDRPALLIAAHTRKPKTDERSNGRALLNMLAGSYTLGSVPRSVFVLQPASDDVEDDQVVLTCCKNNDGKLGPRTAWHRKDGLFIPEPNFSWVEFDAPDKDKRVLITESMVKESIGNGWTELSTARDSLKELSGASRSACYNALSLKGRFGKHLFINDIDKKISWNPSGK